MTDRNGNGILCLTIDNMGSAASVGRGERSGPNPQDPDLVTGFPRCLDLLDKLGLKATFFIEGWNGLHHPERVRELVERGHEVGVHGWVHEVFGKLDSIAAERALIDSLAAFRAIGIEPKGFRAPGGVRGPHLIELLTKHGISYDSSVDEAATETQPKLLEGRLPNVPWLWPMIDYYQYYMHPEGARSPEQLEETWCRAIGEAATQGTLVTIICHAFVSGVDDQRLAALERVLRYAIGLDNLDICTASEVAERTMRASAA